MCFCERRRQNCQDLLKRYIPHVPTMDKKPLTEYMTNLKEKWVYAIMKDINAQIYRSVFDLILFEIRFCLLWPICKPIKIEAPNDSILFQKGLNQKNFYTWM